MMFIALKGFALSATLIIAIGLQNAFILRQGLKNRHVFISAFLAASIDAILIALGVLGFGQVIEAIPSLETWIKLCGAVFLIIYGVRALMSAMKAEYLNEKSAKGLMGQGGVRETVIILLGVSLLNPHVYLDTFLLLGGVAASYGEPGRYIFGLGAGAASFVWFFSLAYGARFLSPLFSKPRAWQILDIVIGLVMFGIAISLIVTI